MRIWLTTPHAGVFFVNTNTLDPSLTFDPNSNQERPVFQAKGVSDQQMGPSKGNDLEIKRVQVCVGLSALALVRQDYSQFVLFCFKKKN